MDVCTQRVVVFVCCTAVGTQTSNKQTQHPDNMWIHVDVGGYKLSKIFKRMAHGIERKWKLCSKCVVNLVC